MYCQEKGTEFPVSEYKRQVRVEEVGMIIKQGWRQSHVKENRGILEQRDE
jgi:hypothetical protein